MAEKEITYEEFLDGYKNKKITLHISRGMADYLILSKVANKYNKSAYLFWDWIGTILLIPLPIILIFINWPYSIISVIWGILIKVGANKSLYEFISQNMLDDKAFWAYVLFQKGAIIKDGENNFYYPNYEKYFKLIEEKVKEYNKSLKLK